MLHNIFKPRGDENPHPLYSTFETLRQSEKKGAAYLKRHIYSDMCVSQETATVIGLARLQCLIHEFRELIECKFTKLEFDLLMKCWPKHVFTPESIEYLDQDFQLFFNREDYDLHGATIIELQQKLLGMTFIEKFALADVIEHVGSKGDVTTNGVDNWGDYDPITFCD